jgi:hypothetical protein
VRGGTSFLFPTAKKKRSKENAFPQSVLLISQEFCGQMFYA